MCRMSGIYWCCSNRSKRTVKNRRLPPMLITSPLFSGCRPGHSCTSLRKVGCVAVAECSTCQKVPSWSRCRINCGLEAYLLSSSAMCLKVSRVTPVLIFRVCSLCVFWLTRTSWVSLTWPHPAIQISWWVSLCVPQVGHFQGVGMWFGFRSVRTTSPKWATRHCRTCVP